ncbi:hypothetical protein JG688_00010470 [Phytophthora aleatoria]|uniref:Uncharacterized protein n=1 Tax=Phytophthora aleatoria TaxID=2496075 RepID=A0A8J5J1Z4_9STRA|nr:hypothetical protein JG688_00010470 [Phytophthora aleatoria]
MKMYICGISRYLELLYQHKRTVLRDELLSSLQTNDHEETGEGVGSLTIAGAIQTKPNAYPINYDLHCSNDFEGFLHSQTNLVASRAILSVILWAQVGSICMYM